MTPLLVKPAPRLPFIDGLRGLAMLLVLLYHCWLFGGAWRINLVLGHHAVDAARLFGYGHIGVNLFLTLSGFCLYWPFVKDGGRRCPTLWEFMKRRCRRILPPYYVVLVLIFGLLLFHAWRGHKTAETHYAFQWFVLHLFMLHNTQTAYVLTCNGALWSLGLEFQLYVLFPLLVEAFLRFPARGVVLAVFLGSTAYRLWVPHGAENSDAVNYTLAYSVFGRCFEFTLGMFAALLVAKRHHEDAPLLRVGDVLFLAALTVAAVIEGRHGHFGALTDAMWGGIFVLLLLLASRPNSAACRLFSRQWVMGLGIFSYSVYLIHLPLVMALGAWASGRRFSNGKMIAFEAVVVIPLVLALGYMFHLLFEKPFMGTPKTKMTPPEGSAGALKNHDLALIK